MLDYYAADYALKRARGQSLEEIEDDPELSLDNVLESLENDTWEDLFDDSVSSGEDD